MAKHVILAGGYRLDTMGASAVRALGIAKLIQSLGFKVVILGKLGAPDQPGQAATMVEIEGVPCRSIIAPQNNRPSASYVRSAEPLMQVVDEVGADKVCAIFCYNYPARGAWAMIREARKRGIAPVLDITEWYGWEGNNVLSNLMRIIGTEVRIRILSRLAGNIVCASNWFRARFPHQHTMLMPFVLDSNAPNWRRSPPPDPAELTQFVYTGSPGVGMVKDRLPEIVASFAQLGREEFDFRFSVAGITKRQYLESQPNHERDVRSLGEKIQFLGRISHTESLALSRSAHFAVFFRKPNRKSNTGFATKFVEAKTLGIPIITNSTSDIPLYLNDEEDGFLAASESIAEVTETLRRALKQTPAERSAMVEKCRSSNPFDMKAWQDPALDFLLNLRGRK